MTIGILDKTSAIELLSPARDLECGRAALKCGADAIYVGAPQFGAREDAGNPVGDIRALTAEAHVYWARVYVTLNTLLYDREIPRAVRLVHELYEAGVDGLIIQDMGLLECDLPPIPLIASTQMHNSTPEKVAFLEQVGFRRVILAREMSLEQIRAVRRAAPRVELESFVHGALCVSYSGQCTMSHALGGRSANRGACAQPCRKPYTLIDGNGAVLEGPDARDRHWLSIRDLNLSDQLEQLLEAGISSFKIEGRLKDMTYVANTTAHYRQQLDPLLARMGLRRASSGISDPGFTPDPAKTFNRGFSSYFLNGRDAAIGAQDTPKMVGERVGRVAHAEANTLTLETSTALEPGDGLAYFDLSGQLCGTSVNGVSGRTVRVDRAVGVRTGTLLFRNHDHAFLASVRKARMSRSIAFTCSIAERDGTWLATLQDEDGVTAEAACAAGTIPAEKPDTAREAIRRQFTRTGGSCFHCTDVRIECSRPPFLPVSGLNAWRRAALDALTAAREPRRPRETCDFTPNGASYPEKKLDYLGNVLNKKAEAFYRRHGVEEIEPAAESGLDMRGRKVMITKYCVKYELGCCPKEGGGLLAEPLTLLDEQGRRLPLRFDCRRCEMHVLLE